MKIITFIFSTALILAICTGCKQSISSELEAANKYDTDKEIIEYSLNTAIYRKAIEDILYYDGGDLEEIKRIATEYQDIISDEFVNELFNNGVVYEEEPISDADDFNMDPDQIGLDNTEISLGSDEVEEEAEDEDGNDTEEEKVFTVTGLDAYNDRLIASVAYKYGDPMKVWVDIVDGKINGYKIYR